MCHHEEIFVTAVLAVLFLAQITSIFFFLGSWNASQKQPQVIYSRSNESEDSRAGMQPARAGAERNERAAPRKRKRLLHEELRPFLFTSHLNFLEMFYSELRQLDFSLVKAKPQFRPFRVITQQVGEESAVSKSGIMADYGIKQRAEWL